MHRLKSALIISVVTPCQADRPESTEGGNCTPVERLVDCEGTCGITVPHMYTGLSQWELKNTHNCHNKQHMYICKSLCTYVFISSSCGSKYANIMTWWPEICSPNKESHLQHLSPEAGLMLTCKCCLCLWSGAMDAAEQMEMLDAFRNY